MSDLCQNPFSESNRKTVLEILQENNFSFSSEIIPPRNGADFKEVFEKVSILKKGQFDFISVTHGAGGSLRGGTLPIAYHAQEVCQITGIAHLTCREMSAEELENLLVDHHYFGIHNILALRGDPPEGIGATFEKPKGGYEYAYQLVEALSKMNKGRYIKRKNFDTGDYRKGLPTRFCIGVAVYPEDKNFDYLKIKKEKGAHFGISQMIFDSQLFIDFHKKVQEHWQNTFPILPGIWVANNLQSLLRMKKKFNVSIPNELVLAMKEAEKTSEQAMQEVGIQWAVDFVEKIKKAGVKGAHFFIMGDAQKAVQVKNRIMDGQ